jgi:hypothetical protein
VTEVLLFNEWSVCAKYKTVITDNQNEIEGHKSDLLHEMHLPCLCFTTSSQNA